MAGKIRQTDGYEAHLGRVKRALRIQDAEVAVSTLFIPSTGQALCFCRGIYQGLLRLHFIPHGTQLS